MKTIKRIDLFAQIGITALLGVAFMQDEGSLPGQLGALNGEAFFKWLFAMGGWQVLSFLSHLFAPRSMRTSRPRRIYACLLLFCLVLAFIPFYGWFVLLLLGPVMAVFYFIICLVELRQLDSVADRIDAAP